jgi:hypothetical protein
MTDQCLSREGRQEVGIESRVLAGYLASQTDWLFDELLCPHVMAVAGSVCIGARTSD